MKIAKLTINEEKRKKANPLVFGHFIEFMRDCIDEGMWAELLKNRGFDKRKEIPTGVVDGNPNIAEGWYRTGCKNTFEITLDSSASLSKDGFSQKIKCYNDYDGYVGVAQGGILLKKEVYKGHIWSKSEEKACIEIVVKGGSGEAYYKKRFGIETEWKKIEFEFCVEKLELNSILEIRLIGEGTVWLDGASLMPENTDCGIWPEVYSHIKALHPPVIRFPGGCFADCYHWEDGVGMRDQRPYRHNCHWGGYEDNSFGTDEYMEFCKAIGCEPMICVNFGSGSAKEAAAWVEYCNGTVDTEYGRIRAENGHSEPYNIKYWDIGNETFGEWEIGHCDASEYARKYLEFYHAMKEKDDSIVFMACAGDGDNRSQKWNEVVARDIKEKLDVLCLHMYTLKAMEQRHYDNCDIYYAVTGSVVKYEEILKESFNIIKKYNSGAQLAVTEYNLGTLIDSYREQTLEAALFNAGMLNMFLRNIEKIKMCNISDLVNGWPGGIIVSKNGHAYGTASYYVMKLYSESSIAEVLSSNLLCEEYDTKEQIGNIEPLKNVPYVDIVVCRNKDGELVIFAVNRSLKESALIQTDLKTTKAEVTEITAKKVSDMNDEKEMRILPVTKKIKIVQGKIELAPHSINRIRV